MDRRALLLVCVCAAAGALVYAGAASGEFVYDDLTYVQTNAAVVGDVHPFAAATPPQRPDLGLYRPLTELSFRAQRDASGALDPDALRRIDVLLHALCSGLVAWLALHLALGARAALFAGLLFALHPAHVEAVAWITQRAELLAAAFALLALLAFGRPTARRPLARSVIAAFCYGLAALSKESALALPLAFVAFDALRRGGASLRTLAARQIAPACVAVAVVVTRVLVLGRFGPDPSHEPFLASLDPADRLLLGAAAFGRAVRTLAWPWNLSVYYENAEFTTALARGAGLIALVVTGVVLLVLTRLGRRGAACGIWLFLAAFLPFAHVVPIGATYADRFLYLPSAGACIGAGAILFPPALRATRRWLLACAVLAACFVLTWSRVPAFRDNLSLWLDAARARPTAALPQYQIASFYKERGQLEYVSDDRRGALYHWRESLQRDPHHRYAHKAHLFLGEYAAGARGDPVTAAREYRAALECDPREVDAMLDLAALSGTEAVSVGEARALLERVIALRVDERSVGIARRLLADLGPASGDDAH